MKHLHEQLDLTGKAAIVTGGAKGIGYGIAYRLAEAGAGVLIADTDEEAASKAAQELTAQGWKAEAIRTDVSSEADVTRMITVCRERFGRLDILVNNAGIYPPAPVALMTEADFERVIEAMKDGDIPSDALRTHSFPIAELPERLPELIADADNVLKAIGSF